MPTIMGILFSTAMPGLSGLVRKFGRVFSGWDLETGWYRGEASEERGQIVSRVFPLEGLATAY